MVLVRVLVAPGRYAGLLSSPQAAAALATGWAEGAGHDEPVTVALADGTGLSDAVAAAHGGQEHVVTVPDPWGRPTPATLLLDDSGSTVYTEAVQVCGPHLRRPGDDPLVATSAGLGHLLRAAAGMTNRVRTLVVGLTGARVLDAGLGLLGELLPDEAAYHPARVALRGGAARLGALRPEDLPDLDAVRWHLRGMGLVALGDLGQPLLGLAGVAATLGAEAGADLAQAHDLERAVGHAVDLVRRAESPRHDLLTGVERRTERQPGAGAGAGLGYGWILIGGVVRDEAVAGLDLVGVLAALDRADLVVTGAAVLGASTIRSSPAAAIAQAAQVRGIPAVALCGRVEAGRRETMAAGFSGTYAVANSLRDWPAFAADPAAALRRRAASVARTWSPGPRD